MIVIVLNPIIGHLREVWHESCSGTCWHILLDPSNPDRMHVAISAAGVFRTDDGGQVYGSADDGDSWEPFVRDLPAVLSVEAQVLS